MTRRQRARRHKPKIAHTSSYVSSHLGPKSQGLAIHMTLQLLHYLYQQPAVSHCEVEPRVGGTSQLPLRPSVARFCDSFGKPRPERIKAYISLYHTSPRSLLSVKADTRVPELNMHLFSGCNFLSCRFALPIDPQTSPLSPCMPMPQHSSSTVPITVPSYPSICSIRLSATPSRLLFLTLLMRSICPALTHPMPTAPTADSCRVSQAPTRIHKRSYKRAVARAAQSQHGGTIYKGRWCTLRGLSQQYLPQAQTSSASTRSARVRGPQPTGPHVRFLSLNCGGLSQDLYVELLKALEAMPAQTQPQIVALQETHWSSDSAQQYTTGAWQVVQSHRHDNRSAGVMFLVHRSLTQHAVLSFGEPFPGRILHVRITAKGWALDCVNVYQQTMNWQRPAKDVVKPGEPKSPTAYELRQQVWTSLHQTLTKLPHRHTLLLLGDFNTPMQQHERAGPRVANWNSRLPSDASRLTHLLEDHDLIHLNSWSKRMGPTFVWGETRTLIDHVFTRCENADSLARYTGRDCLRVGEWRKGGKHIPLSGTIHLRRFAALNRLPQPHKTGWDKSILLQLVREPEDPRAYALVAQVQDTIGKCSTVQDINDCLVQAASTHAPAGAQATANAPWQMATLDTSVKDMWQHYRQWKAAARGTTATIWKVWFHYARFQRAHRAFRSAGRFAKKQWYQGRLDELNKHARRHDVRALYQGVRTLAPKSRRVHVQLRDKDGHVITPAEQATLLQCHYEAVYTGLQPQPTRSTQMPALQVTEEQLERALSLMPTHKAVPLHLAPLAAWKLCAQVVLPRLTEIVNNLVITPELWHTAWLSLIPKISKPTLPKHLRPIGLSEVSNRMVTKVLQDRLRPYVEKYLEDIPQWAYIPGRSTLDAAARAQAHCQHIIRLCSPDRWTVREARAGLSRPKPNAGGLQLSLDLSSAFDVLEWVYVAEALDDAGVPAELKDHLLEWYRDLRYEFSIQNHTATVSASRGLKQGCLVAPLIWSLVTGRLLYRLALVTDVRWVSQHITAYADDFHAAVTAHNHQDLHTAECYLGHFLELLVQSGMIINASKSAILYRFKGNFAKKWLRQHIAHGPDGPRFRIRTHSGRLFEFPVADSHTYLGTKISYTDPQLQTLVYRMDLAKVEWSRLRKLVCSRHGLLKQDRLRIWFSSVPPTLLYGLAATGLPNAGGRQLRSIYMRHLRAILRCPAHLSHISNREVLTQARLPDICAILEKEMLRLAHNVHQLAQQDSFLVTDCLHHHMQFVRTTLQAGCLTTEQTASPCTTSAGPESMFACRYCGRFFATHCLRRSHESRVHGSHTPKPQPGTCTFDRWAHSIDGTPTCRHCGHQFRKWHNLQKHIVQRQCRALGESVNHVPAEIVTSEAVNVPPHSTQAYPDCEAPATCTLISNDMPLPLLQRPSIRSILVQSGWHALLHCEELQLELQHHCPFCRQWCMDQAAIKRHMTQQHDEWVQQFANLMPHMTPFRRHMVLPCRYCHLHSVNKHTHWRNCLIVQVSCYLGIVEGIPAVTNGADGALGPGEKLLQRHMSIPRQPRHEEGTRGGLPGNEEGQTRGSCQSLAQTAASTAERQGQRQGEGQEQGQRRTGLLAYFRKLGSDGGPARSPLGQLLGTGHELPRPTEHCPAIEPADAAPRICPGQLATGYKHVPIRQAGGRRSDSNHVLCVGEMEQDSGREPPSHRLVAQDCLDESLPHRAVQSTDQHCQERREHAGSPLHGMADRCWGMENTQVGSCPREASGGAGCTHQDHGKADPRGQRTSQDHQCGESLSIPICLRTSQRSPDVLGQAGDRSVIEESWGTGLGRSARMDWICSSAHHGMSTSEGTRRPVLSGPAASMVIAGQPTSCRALNVASTVPSVMPSRQPCTLQSAFPVIINDTPAGVRAILQCLLWPLWCDAQRTYLTHGMYHQLWMHSMQQPETEVHLSRKLQWTPLIRKLQTMPKPSLDDILTLFLKSHHSDAHSGEWGTHPHALDEVGARAKLPDTCMCLHMPVLPVCTTLQECVDAWGDTPSRHCLLRPAETIFISLKHDRRGSDAGNPRYFEDLEADIAMPVASQNSEDTFLVHYQVRSVVTCWAAASAAGKYWTLHRCKREHSAKTLDPFALPHPNATSVLLLALRRCNCQESDSCE